MLTLKWMASADRLDIRNLFLIMMILGMVWWNYDFRVKQVVISAS